MPEGDGVLYNNPKESYFNGGLDMSNDTLKLSLHTGYTPDIDADDVWDDISATEYPTADGYTALGQVLDGQIVTRDDPNDKSVFDGTDETWSNLGPLDPPTPSHLVLRASVSGILIAYWVLGTTPTNGDDFVIAWPAAGILDIG